jgi:imidazolonepropionase-like amidohydrolase
LPHLFAQRGANELYTLLKPDRVFDGKDMRTGWWVLVKDNHIAAAGEPKSIIAPASAKIIDLKGMTLMPGLNRGALAFISARV